MTSSYREALNEVKIRVLRKFSSKVLTSTVRKVVTRSKLTARLSTALGASLCTAVFATLLIGSGPVFANDSITEKPVHLGASSCASSTCHGSSVSFDESNILRNEFRTWNELDPHARAYQTLLSKESADIAAKLGLASAAQADACLNCHADNVPAKQRGDDFRIQDGVSCETCHGGAQHYLTTHTQGSHAENLNAGLFPSEQATARATLCLSCHLGNSEDRKITHTLMGAGHPRLSFELNTFGTIQPAHYEVDDDYVSRKGPYSELQNWAIGQIVAAQMFLDNVRHFPRAGVFPELVHMDCLGCHQAMSKLTWSKNPLTQIEAGTLRYNDKHLLMSYQIALAVRPKTAAPLLKKIRVFLNSNVSQRRFEPQIKSLRASLEQVRKSLAKEPIDSDQGMSLLNALLEIGLASSHRDYGAAEQSAMAINSVLRVLDKDGHITQNRQRALRAIDTLFDSLNEPSDYRASEFIQGLQMLKAAIE